MQSLRGPQSRTRGFLRFRARFFTVPRGDALFDIEISLWEWLTCFGDVVVEGFESEGRCGCRYTYRINRFLVFWG